MRIFNWVQTKLNGKLEKKDFDGSFFSYLCPPQPVVDHNDEFHDWPYKLLSIGTLNSTSLRKEEEMQYHPSDFTIEEVLKLQKELTKMLKNKPKSFNNGSKTGKKKTNFSLNNLLNYPSNLLNFSCGLEEEGDNGDLSPNSIIILKKLRECLIADNCSRSRQKSLSFLLKKIFVCKSGFAPAFSLRDPIIVSRMEKILRVIVYKKIFPQSSVAVEVKKYLENKLSDKVTGSEEEEEDRRFKWDKTDSDFIVLEM